MSLFVRLIILLLAIHHVARADSSEISVLERYPGCDYESLGEVKVGRTFNAKLYKYLPELFAAKLELLISQLKEQAFEKGASAILLQHRVLSEIDRDNQIASTFGREARFLLTAEAIRGCDSVEGLQGELAPLNAFGIKQQALTVLNIKGWQKTFQLDIPAKQALVTEALSTGNISLKEGAFGVSLGDSFDSVVTTLGTPTFQLTLDSGTLINYGRKVYFVFHKGSLVYVSNKNRWLTQSLVNRIPFDEGIDEQAWLIANTFRLNQNISVTPTGWSSVENGIEMRQKDVMLTVNFDIVDGIQIVDSFELRDRSVTDMPSTIPAQRYHFFTDFSHYLAQEERFGLSVDSLNVEAIGVVRLNSAEALLILDQHTLAMKRGGDVTKVFLQERLFSDRVLSGSGKWQFGDLYEGQSKDKAISRLGNEAFELGGRIEVTHDSYLQTLYFDDADDNQPLLSTEIAIF